MGDVQTTQQDLNDDIGGDELTPAQELFIAALLSTPTIRDAAKKSKIGESTAYRWLADPVFASVYKMARVATLDAATNELRQAALAAVKTLRSNLDAAAPGDQIRAATTILNMAYKSAEMGEMADRMADIEALLASAVVDNEAGAKRR